ncbi:NADP-dependent oxidoreductase domain-containing protein [Cladochytrium replicatum]|nr:NADP-dependent oxidoreductase domain-containing protein [Cladochytrium replicatum]
MASANVSLPENFYVRLGNTGLKVSKICVGCMSFGDPAWRDWAMKGEDALPIIKASYDIGINFFDTANSYSNGASEKALGEAIKKYNIPRETVVIATKLYFRVSGEMSQVGWFPQHQEGVFGPNLANQRGLSRKHIFEACEASLKRLGTDYIDLYQIHRWDKETPIEETMEALNDLVRMGKVRYIGASSMWAWQVAKANAIAEKNGWAKFVSMQNLYNLLYREEEREMIPYCVDAGMGIIPWGPLSAGILSLRDFNTSARSAAQQLEYDSLTPADREILKRLAEVAKKIGKSPSQVAIAWVLAKNGLTAPIIGVSKLKYVEEAIAATHIKLADEDIKFLEEPYHPKAVKGHA